MLFSEIYGLADVKETLIKSVNSNHVAHAQMFAGKKGSANLALALAYATYINCEDKQAEDSCGQCASCVKMAKHIHPDVQYVYPNYKKSGKEADAHKALLQKSWREFLIDSPYRTEHDWSQTIAAENKQCIISVDDGRGIKQFLSLKAFEAEYKIVIIWMPEKMNGSAANAILKNLEEPPAKTLFLLVTNDVEQNITTIISRCQTVIIPSFSDDELGMYLSNKMLLPDNEVEQLVLLADGNLHEAIRLHEKGTEEGLEEEFKEWMRLCYGVQFEKLVHKADAFSKISKDSQKMLFQVGLNMMRNILLTHGDVSDLVRAKEEDKVFVQKFSSVVTVQKVEDIVPLLNEAYFLLERNVNPKMLYLDLSFSITKIFKS